MTKTTRRLLEDRDLRSELVVFLATVGASTPDDHPWVTTARRLADRVNALDAAAEREARLRERVEGLTTALEDATRHLGLYVQDDDDADPAAWEAFARATAALAAFAPAGTQEGTDGD